MEKKLFAEFTKKCKSHFFDHRSCKTAKINFYYSYTETTSSSVGTLPFFVVYSYNSVARTLTSVTITYLLVLWHNCYLILAFTTSSATIFSVIQCLPSYNSMIPGSHEGGSHCLWFSCRRRGHAVARAPPPPPPGGHGGATHTGF